MFYTEIAQEIQALKQAQQRNKEEALNLQEGIHQLEQSLIRPVTLDELIDTGASTDYSRALLEGLILASFPDAENIKISPFTESKEIYFSLNDHPIIIPLVSYPTDFKLLISNLSSPRIANSAKNTKMPDRDQQLYSYAKALEAGKLSWKDKYDLAKNQKSPKKQGVQAWIDWICNVKPRMKMCGWTNKKIMEEGNLALQRYEAAQKIRQDEFNELKASWTDFFESTAPRLTAFVQHEEIGVVTQVGALGNIKDNEQSLIEFSIQLKALELL